MNFDFNNSWQTTEIVTEVKTNSVLLEKLPLKTNQYNISDLSNADFFLHVQHTRKLNQTFPAILFAKRSDVNSSESQECCIWDGELLLTTHEHVSHELHNSLVQGKISLFIDIKYLQKNPHNFELLVVLNNSSFSPVDDPADDKLVTRRIHSGRKDNLKYLFQNMFELKDDCIQFEAPFPTEKKSIEELYQYIQECCLTKYKHYDIMEKYQHPSLHPSMRKYQARAVHWMYLRETQEETNADLQGIHPLWQEIQCRDGNLIYLQLYSGKVSREIPPPDPLPRGGILADEMGLGKTVEILALHLNNQRPSFQINPNCTDSCQEKPKVSLARDIVLKRTGSHENNQNAFNIQPKIQKLDKKSDTSDPLGFDKVINLLNGCEKHENFASQKTSLKKPLSETYQTITSLEGRNCFICSEAISLDNNVFCYTCFNVMHEKCTGYNMRKVLMCECPTCAMKEIIDTHCTLIVCPDTLQEQWYDEVMKHIKNGQMKIMIYKGVKQHKFLQPKFLAEYDLIITSFNTLRHDFNYVNKGGARGLRYEKKYASLPCPLLAINFWRLCIDEAQMVETNNTKLAEMALRIIAVNRWCVTGTPFTRGVEDAYGLLLFLGVRPYYVKLWWKRALCDHYDYGDFLPLFDVISRVMWRNCKVDVLEEICIPKQTEYVSWLHFSAVERHFYQQQFHELSTRGVAYLQKKFPDSESQSLKISHLSKDDLDYTLHSLLQVRQACIHPAVVRNGYLSMEKKCVTMYQVLEKLVNKAKLECEEAHRKLLCALNGLAGLELLKNDVVKATNYYQDAIDLWLENKEFKTDSLQKLHTLHNLCEIHPMISKDSHNLKIDLKKLSTEKDQLRTDYMLLVDGNVKFNEDLFLRTKQELKEIYLKMNLSNVWWLDVIGISISISTNNLSEQLATKITRDLTTSKGQSLSSIRNKFNSLHGLKFILHEKLEMIENVRADVLESLTKILRPPTKENVFQASECCLRPEPESDAERCLYCVVEDGINNYERYLFSQQGTNAHIETNGRGFRSDTDVDIVLKTLHNFAKHHAMGNDVIERGKNHLKYMDGLKKEFMNIRPLYMACHGRLQAIDELDMCTMRLRFEFLGEANSERKNHVVKPTEVEVTRLTLLSDQITATTELKTKQGRWLYLLNLSKVQSEHDGYNPELCPICVVAFGVEWAVFTCGHCVCCRCVVQLQSQSVAYSRDDRSFVRCPICRVVMGTQQVSYVVTKQKKIEGFDSEINVKGHHSTKIAAILRRVLWIQGTDPGAKILVFSTWTNVLQLIATALTDNDVLYKNFDGNIKHAQASLASFKESSNYNLLLLLLHSGSKGLNIIEATHVILAEPALNPGDELQAVGRVHRIGQTKETFVHRFLVKRTVEEKMFNMLKTKKKTDNTGSSTNAELTIADLSSLFQRDEE